MPRAAGMEPEPEQHRLEAGSTSRAPWRRVHVDGRGFGLFAEREIAAGEVLVREEVPIVAAQDPAGSTVLPACIVCLRPCGTSQDAIRHVLDIVGEADALVDPSDSAATNTDDDSDAKIARCPSCSRPLCSPECSSRCGPHLRLCAHPLAARLRQLAANASDSVWLAALSVAEIILAAEQAVPHVPQGSGLSVLQKAQADATAAEHRRRFGDLHTVAWEDIPRWSLSPAAAADSAEAADIDRYCRLRRCIVEEVAQLVQEVFPGNQWMAVTCPESISSLMGTMDSSCILPWIRCDHLNLGWADKRSKLVGKLRLQELVASIHEAVQRDFEDHAVALSPRQRYAEDLADRRSEPLWQQGLPPVDGAALYHTGGMMNHCCAPNIDCTWSNSCRATFAANRTIRVDEELCIAYCDPSEPVSKRRQRLLEDFGFVCQCELCVVEGGDDVTAEEVLRGASGRVQKERVDQTEAQEGKQDEGQHSTKTKQQQRLHAAALRVHAEKFQSATSGTASAKWHEGYTSSGSRYWSFTDGNGRARVSFNEPFVSPSQWLYEHDKES